MQSFWGAIAKHAATLAVVSFRNDSLLLSYQGESKMQIGKVIFQFRSEWRKLG
jgi:hypothetical protein